VSKVFVVLSREYRTQVQSKSFIITLVLMPIFMGGSILFSKLFGEGVETDDRRIVVIDHTGTLFAQLKQRAEERNKTEVLNDKGKRVLPPFLLEEIKPAADARKQQLGLSDKVRNKELYAFVEIGRNLIAGAPAEVGDFFRYYSNSPTDREFQRWVAGPLNELVMTARFEEVKLPPALVAGAIRPIDVENLGLVTVDESGQIIEAEEADRAAAFLVPYGFCMLIFMAIMITGPQLMQNVIEEKMQRIAEVLIGSIPPFQLMLGKLLGLVGVSLTLLSLYLAGGWFVADYFGRAELIPLERIGWVLAYGALGILMFGAVFCAIGAACNEIKDAQNLLTPVMIVAVLPLMLIVAIIKAPNGALATGVSFFPPVTPMVMVMRMAVPPGIPTWQPVAGIFAVLLFTLLCVFAAGRIFRIGILSQGKTPKLGELMRWAVTG
jgi:ABC-2 type transport system permease protein